MKSLLVLAALMAPALAQTPPPLPPENSTAQTRGIAGTGEMLSAAPLCGLRSSAWVETLRARIDAALSQTGESYANRILAAHWASQMEVYGRSQVADRRQEYCAFISDPRALRSLDRIVAGHREWWWQPER